MLVIDCKLCLICATAVDCGNDIRQMAPLFSKVDSNKLWHDVQNKETMICAKFGEDLFNISKVIGRKTKWPRFFGLPGTLS